MKDQSSSAWLQLICEQLALLWEKKEVPLLRIVARGLCYLLISKGAFLGDGDFHPSKRRGAQAFLDVPVKSVVLSCWGAVLQCLETHRAGKQATYKQGKEIYALFKYWSEKYTVSDFYLGNSFQSPRAAASRTSGPSHQCWSLENEAAEWNWRQSFLTLSEPTLLGWKIYCSLQSKGEG